MDKLARKDLTGNGLPLECYIRLRDQEITEDVRSTEAYKDRCCEAVGLGPVPDERYTHITNPDDLD